MTTIFATRRSSAWRSPRGASCSRAIASCSSVAALPMAATCTRCAPSGNCARYSIGSTWLTAPGRESAGCRARAVRGVRALPELQHVRGLLARVLGGNPLVQHARPGRRAARRNVVKEARMDQETFNISLRKFLKMVGVSSQREIEQAVAKAIAEGTLGGVETVAATMTLQIAALQLEVRFEQDIHL